MHRQKYESITVSVQEQDGRYRGDNSSAIEKPAWARLAQSWTFEFAGFLVSLGSLAAVVAILRLYDGRPIPNWPLTINFVLSLIGNVGFTGTMFGVHATVAQLKWIWFAKTPRPLADLAAFQKARGGAVGVLQLLYTTGAQLIVVTVSLAMTFGMLWGPFIQNLVRYESGNMAAEDGLALLARGVQYDGHGMRSDSGYNFPDPLLELNMMVSLASGSSKDVNLPQFFCSTGNCTWPPVATLGFCSRCTDITERILLNCRESIGIEGNPTFKITDCSAILANGTAGLAITGNTASFENLMNITQVGGSGGLLYHAIRLLQTPLLNGLFRPPLSRSDFAATECSLRPCVLSSRPSVRNGVYAETPVDVFMEAPPEGWTWQSHQLRPPWGLERGIDPAANLSFGLSRTVLVDWMRHDFLIQQPITGFTQTSDGHSGIEFCSTAVSSRGQGYCSPSNIVSHIFNANYTTKECGSVNMDTFSCAMEGIGRAITKTMRNSGTVANGTGIGDAFLARGQAETVATFIRVQWYWIALPATVWLLGFITWVITAVQTRRLRLPIWRDDPLPLLFVYNPENWNLDSPPLTHTRLSGNDRAREEILKADNYSTWACTKVAEDIHVQLRTLPPLPENNGVTASAMRLMRAGEN